MFSEYFRKGSITKKTCPHLVKYDMNTSYQSQKQEEKRNALLLSEIVTA